PRGDAARERARGGQEERPRRRGPLSLAEPEGLAAELQVRRRRRAAPRGVPPRAARGQRPERRAGLQLLVAHAGRADRRPRDPERPREGTPPARRAAAERRALRLRGED